MALDTWNVIYLVVIVHWLKIKFLMYKDICLWNSLESNLEFPKLARRVDDLHLWSDKIQKITKILNKAVLSDI